MTRIAIIKESCLRTGFYPGPALSALAGSTFAGMITMIALLGLLLTAPAGLQAQNVIGGTTGDPSAVLELQSTNAGLLLPRMTLAERNAIASPAEGLLIYNTTLACIELNTGSSSSPYWQCLAGAGKVASLNCADASLTGTLLEATPASGISLQLPYTGGNGYQYRGLSATSTGITGLTATLPAGAFAEGDGSLSLAITGTPSGVGTASFALTVGGQSCTLTVTVIADPAALPVGSGSFAGLTCFDIALSNDNINNCAPLSVRLMQKADFTNAATHTQVYTFTPTGTVSNVRFAYINTNGSVVTGLSGGNSGSNVSTAVTATVNYNTSLNSLALGLTNSNALTAELYVIYNDGATNNGTDQQLKLTVQVKDCLCCGAYVAPGEWKQFMCHNLGANESVDPFEPSWELIGNYYQWGRNPTCFGIDGIDAANPCSSPVYGAAAPWGSTTANDNAGAITGWNTTAAPNGAWTDGSKTVNDPCPPGFRVPTAAQMTGLANSTLNPGISVGTWTSGSTEYGSGWRLGHAIFLPTSGGRLFNNGSLDARGNRAGYWSSSDDEEGAQGVVLFSGSVSVGYNDRLFGFSLRCIAE